MMKDIVSRIERAIVDELAPDPSRLAAGAKGMSLAFTSGRGDLAAGYMDDPDALYAYVAAFLLPNAAKVAHAILQLDELGGIRRADRMEVLDIGAGPGTATLSASLALERIAVHSELCFMATDRSAAALDLARRLFKRLAPHRHSLETLPGSLSNVGISSAGLNKKFDLIIAANILNEFDEIDTAHAAVCALFEKNIRSDGALIIIDPALRETSRPIMELRDRVLADRIAAVAAPCLHQGSCPMLAANERDWCHFYIDWDRPALIEEIDSLANMDRRHLKMSYLLLQPEGVANRESRITSHGRCWRAVSSPIDSKGKRELWLCGCSGRLLRTRRTGRDASELNADFDRVMRGDVVRCADKDRIRKEDEFAIVKKWK